MSDVPTRIAVAVAITGAAVAIALRARVNARRGAAAAPLDLAGFRGRLLLFTDAHCRRCQQARAVLEEMGVEFVEAAFDREPERLRAVGVTAVPLLVGRDAAGREVGRIAGRIGRRSLARLIARME